MRSAALQKFCGVLAQRRHHIRFAVSQPEAGGRDADNRIEFSVESNRSTESFRPSSEVALPETVTEDYHGRCAGPVLFGQEGAPLREIDAQHGKQIGRDFLQVDILRVARSANRSSVEQRTSQDQRVALALAIEKIRVCKILIAKHFCVPSARSGRARPRVGRVVDKAAALIKHH